MKYTKYFAGFALAVGLLAAGTTPASAQEYRRRDALRADIARDRARLNEDIRCGRREAARRDAANLARDQRAIRYRRDWR
jgi:hypothetical protein